MDMPLQITFKGMKPSEALERRVRREAEGFTKIFDRIISARVIIVAPGKSQAQGGLFSARIHIKLPEGKRIDVTREPDKHQAHEDPYVAVRDAFRAAKRALREEIRKFATYEKPHEPPPMGRILRLFADEGYGFLRSPDGHEVYFHANAVAEPGFEALKKGDAVSYEEEAGKSGPQARFVKLFGRRASGEEDAD